MNKKNLIWIAQIAVAVIIGQTLFFKFTDAQETIDLFAQLGVGAEVYKTLGIVELAAVILLLVPRTAIYGAFLSLGLMSGAIMSHITVLGFSGPTGQLGLMAIAAWALSLATIYVRREEIPFYQKLVPQHAPFLKSELS